MWTGLASKYFGDLVPEIPTFGPQNSASKVGINSLANRFHLINDIIPLTWLNLSMKSFKLKC